MTTVIERATKHVTRLKLFQLALGIGMFMWGYGLYDTSTFSVSSAYDALALIGDEHFWGVAAMGFGLTRIFFVLINGGMRHSIYFRLASGIFGAGFWSCICVGFMMAASSTAPPTYAMIVAFEFLILGWAVDDWHRNNSGN